MWHRLNEVREVVRTKAVEHKATEQIHYNRGLHEGLYRTQLVCHDAQVVLKCLLTLNKVFVALVD